MALVPGIDRLGGLLYKLRDSNEKSTVISHMSIVVAAETNGAALPAGRAAPVLAYQQRRFARQDAPYDADTEL